MPRKVLVFRASHVLKDWINGIEPADQTGMGRPDAGSADGGMGAASPGPTYSGSPVVSAREPVTGVGSSGHELPEDSSDRGGSSGT